MIIFYGTRSGESEKRLPHPCGHCQQPALVQTDWYRYFHVMFIPTFPVGKQRSIQCRACGNSFDAKGSAPIWTYVGGVVLALCFLGGAAHQAIRRLGLGGSFASITSAASAPSASASVPAPAAVPASAPARVASPHPPVAVAATSDGGVPATSTAGARKPKKKKK